MDIITLLILVGAVLAFFMVIGLVMARLYRRATRETSLVKTGAGGKKVIMDGGVVVVPLLHEVSPVNMKTLRLEVKRDGDGALITKDRMRVDVGVEFYVSVQPTDEGVARAAQTLGARTFDVEQLREMIEGKLIDSLRAVAAQMTMDQLHENRADFVQEVQNTVSEDLLKNGLSLEAVSLTALDQTPFEALDENNAFNAVGMRKLAEVIAQSKKERANIEAEAQVAVRRAEMEAERQRLTIQKDEEQARIAQEQEIETLKAAQEAEIAARTEDSMRETERARIAREESVRAAEIERERKLREAEIAKERELEVADQEKQIIIQQKSEEESRARASADLARAEATKAMEAVTTAKEVAEAERLKQIALIEAAREAEREATKIRLAAQAEKEAASDRAEARREEAQAEADALTIRAEAKKKDMLAEAEGKRAITDAENALSAELISMKVDLARLEAMPKVLAEAVKPAEKIDSIRIHQVGGLNGGSNGGGSGSAGDKPPVNQALDSIMGMAVQMPALKKLGDELGLSMDGTVSGLLGETPEPSEAATPEADEPTAPVQ
ncbi:Inner membrane protein YqiK [Pelagimonas phthalicica]|uniref:Inner membrane protein YqiK n=1 Tax=Pelagimonas phthalicica TaxID=1037362 RepID=A0A238J7Q9_9RHOB|nr:flotillin domain-containing protein [Pelagimonas phthalicica]TDS95093.1 putative membrane protein YqiK [Pelagimonas phthalicica]SMX26383.1 Inner membrane protein YqiK [Pelagimonas phthalicica]